MRHSVYVSGDVARDQRWLKWGARVHDELGVRSDLSQRLLLSDDAGVIAGLNIHSHAADAFDEHTGAMGLVLATLGGLMMNSMLANDRVRNLQLALESNREIGVAIGALMHEHRLSQAQAFDVLRAASQDSNRKLADIAIEVGDTGTLNIRGWPARPEARLAERQTPSSHPPSRQRCATCSSVGTLSSVGHRRGRDPRRPESCAAGGVRRASPRPCRSHRP